jgi:hypothetical protein
VVNWYAMRHGFTLEEFEALIQEDLGLSAQYTLLTSQFDHFKERIIISKLNPQSLKTVFRKYLAYVRYLTYHASKDTEAYHVRFLKHLEILQNE